MYLKNVLCLLVLVWVGPVLAADGQGDALLWNIEAGKPLPDAVSLRIGDESADTLPAELFQDPNQGPRRVEIVSSLKAGVYELVVTYRNPQEKASHIEVTIDGRAMPIYETYRFAGAGTVCEYIYPFRVSDRLEHTIEIAVAPVNSVYYSRHAASLPLVSIGLRAAEVHPAAGPKMNRPVSDLWGWMACITYQRPEAATLQYMKEKTVDEPARWGANFVQAYPHVRYRQWTGNWDRQEIDDYISYCHSRGFLFDEHGGANPREVDRSITSIEHWGVDEGNLLKRGWDTVVDTWEVESLAAALVSLEPEEVIRKISECYHSLWTFNPGTPFNLCHIRPNTYQANPPQFDCVEVYRGPNFVKTIMCAGWSEMPGGPPLPVLSYIDMNPIRVFPGDLGMNDGSRDMFLGYQADSRLFSYSPPGSVHGAIFGGGTAPDLILRQCDDFFRPRYLAPEQVHESAIWWLGETAQLLPPSLRDAVYAASHDPIRHAYTARLSATGLDGSLNRKFEVFTEIRKCKPTGPWWPRANEAYPATTSFIQNNYFRLLRYAAGDYGVLQFDPQHAAHFDSNGLAVDMAAGLRVDSHASEETLLEKVNTQGTYEIEVSSARGLLRFCFEETRRAANVQVAVNGNVLGQVSTRGGDDCLPVDFGMAGGYRIEMETTSGQPLTLSRLEYIPSTLRQGEALWSYEKGDASWEVAEDGAVRIHFDAPEGNYQLRIGAAAADEATVRIYRDGWSLIQNTEDWGGFEETYKMGFCGDITVSGAMRDYYLNLDLTYEGRHCIELVPAEGVELAGVSLRDSAVRHRWLERGGHRAVLEERLTREGGAGTVQEVRRYTVDNDRPCLEVDIQRHQKGQAWSYVLRFPGYEGYYDFSEGFIRLRAEHEQWPGAVILIDNYSELDGVSFSQDGRVELQCQARADSLKMWVVAGDVLKRVSTSTLRSIVSRPQTRVVMPEGGGPATLSLTGPSDWPAVVRVENPAGGAYHVREDGWWYYRGAQPSKAHAGVDYLKIYGQEGDRQAVQSDDYVEGVVRADRGSQYLLALREIEKDDDERSCVVRVLSATAYIFAPRLLFAEPFDTVMLDGKPWPYYDERYVFLPTRPGTYRISVRRGGGERPHLMCTSGMLHLGQWSEEDKTLSLEIGLQPWNTSIPEEQMFFAMIDRAGYQLKHVEGAELVEYEGIARMTEEVRKEMGERGFNLRFRPMSQEEPQAGRIRMIFE